MMSDIKEGILLVILLIIGLILILFDILTMPKHAKKEESKSVIIWDDAGQWFDARAYLQYQKNATLLGATGVIISMEEEEKK